MKPADLPKIPGLVYTASGNPGPRSQGLRFVNGYAVVGEAIPIRGAPVPDAPSAAAPAPSATSPVAPATSTQPGWLVNDKKARELQLTHLTPLSARVNAKTLVLRFNAWFEEAVPNDPKVSSRVRYFEILFYVVDGTIEVNESNVARYLKRTRVPKGAAPPPGEQVTSVLGVEDLAVASDLTIYSQTFHLVSCDSFTREFYAELGMEQAADIPAPQTARDTQNARASAAAARSHTQSAMQRGVQFLQNDGKVLHFTGLLFDPALEGGSRPVTLNMYLADDTGEVKDAVAGLLLHRQRLPLELPSTGVASFGQHEGGYLRADMLRVGGTHTIYARRIQLLDCDAFSRNWFREHNIEQPPAIPGPSPPPPRQKAPLPPHNGYGSPADSARNCLSLIPKAHKTSKSFHQFENFSGQVLRFAASMDTADEIDKSRSFVVNFFLEDDTLSIFEPQQPDRPASRFLERMCVTLPGTDTALPPSALRVGARLQIYSRTFVLNACDQFTSNFMAEHPELWN